MVILSDEEVKIRDSCVEDKCWSENWRGAKEREEKGLAKDKSAQS